MPDILRIGNAQAFWGDDPDAPARLATQAPDLDFLTLDYLAEVSMSILAKQREKDGKAGYARDFLGVVGSLVPIWRNGRRLRVVTNAGGLNPRGSAEQCATLLATMGCHGLRIGVVAGDDVLALMADRNGHSPGHPGCKLTTANAYLGAQPIADALARGADIVITGRVADPSLCVGPCLAQFGWQCDDYDRIAGATVAGHLIECGTQVTGGISTDWLDLPDSANIGFPIVEIGEDGSCIVTKPDGTGGRVDEQTVKEQLLYEIGDPENYLSPDVTASFLTLSVAEIGENRVAVRGATGRAPPASYKVSATFPAGYRAVGMLTVVGPDAVEKCRRCGEIVRQRLAQTHRLPREFLVECIGAGDVAPALLAGRASDGGPIGGHGIDRSGGPRSLARPANSSRSDGQAPAEVVLRIAVADPNREIVEHFTRQLAPLISSGPQGITGYAEGRPPVREVFGYWPTLIDRNLVHPTVDILEVS